MPVDPIHRQFREVVGWRVIPQADAMKSSGFAASAFCHGVVKENCREIREPAEQELSDLIDEEKPEILRVEVVRQGLAFVIGARTQETAITTWFSEAFYRDCGSGD